jgi:hypothetical protein
MLLIIQCLLSQQTPATLQLAMME